MDNITLNEKNEISCFNVPTQIKFWDCEGHQYLGAIGNNDYIICGCCGGTIPLEDLYEDYNSGEYDDLPEEKIHIYPNWLNISEEIVGE